MPNYICLNIGPARRKGDMKQASEAQTLKTPSFAMLDVTPRVMIHQLPSVIPLCSDFSSIITVT